jgi:hypothetical protein
MTETKCLPCRWRGAEILWLSPFDVLPPAKPHDQEQVRALRAFINPFWDLERVPPVPVADEGLPKYQALSGSHRLGVAREIAADNDTYLVPCIPISCPPGDYKAMVSDSERELADWLDELGLYAAADALLSRYLRLPPSESQGDSR